MNVPAQRQPGLAEPALPDDGNAGVAWLSEHFETDGAESADEAPATMQIAQESWTESSPESTEPPRRTVVGGFLIALSIAWIGTVAWAAGQATSGTANGTPDLVRWAAIASGPLALLGLGWLLFGQSSRKETVRFTRAVQAMRAESEALQAVLTQVGQALSANRVALADGASRFMHLGEEAAERLGAVTRDVDAGAQAMARYAETLDRAAGSARTDMGVLLADLPRADARARAMAELLRTTGLDAHQQAGALEAQVALLTARAREADEATSGAAGRMAAHLAQVDSAAIAATARMESATSAMSTGIDVVLSQAADAIRAVRTGLDEQAAAMMATIDQSRATFERLGSDADLALAQRADVVRASLAEGGDALRALAAESAKTMEEQASLALSLAREALDALERAGLDAGGDLTKRADVARQMLHEQGADMVASVQKSNAELETAATAAADTLARRVGEIGSRIDALGSQIATQNEVSRAMIDGVDQSMAGMKARVGALSDEGDRRLNALADNASGLAATIDTVVATIGSGDMQIAALATQVETLKSVLDSVGAELTGDIAAGIADLESRTGASREAAASLSPEIASLAESADVARARLAEAEGIVTRQRDGLDGLLQGIDTGLNAVALRIEALGTAVAETDVRADKLLRDTGPQLIESLLRVRETANQAAERAREAISAAIPDAAASLAEATGAAMNAAITQQVTLQMGELGTLTEQAVEAARGASERLTRQMLLIGETVAAGETRIAEAQEALREADSEQFSRRVALLIESLNSTAIDVTKILSNEVTDSAWAAYLKGDRGVFTRRAVRLLEAGEAREIARHYEEEPEFREQVNRYIADFENMLRRILAERDGSPLGVTLLSSDMGKLYVALAQAIERIRG